MPNKVLWDAAPTDQGAVIDLGTTLADVTFSALGSELDNSTNLNTLCWLELTTSSGNLFSSAVTAATAAVDVYMVRAPDGTNYENTPDVAGEFSHCFIGGFPIPTETEVKPIVIGPFPLPPMKVKFLVYNRTGQTMQNTWEVNLYTADYEVQ